MKSRKNKVAKGKAELERGREALGKRAWATAFARLSAADKLGAATADDLVGLSICSQLIGKDVEGRKFLARAHEEFLKAKEKRKAARCAGWLGHIFQFVGDRAQANGWLARAHRLLEGDTECVEQGYLLLPQGLRAVQAGNLPEAYRCFGEALAVGERCGDRDLIAMGLHGQGRALIRQGEIDRGVALLDEAMVSVKAGEVTEITAGMVYCSVLESCRETFDFGRAQEWTDALNEWCAEQPEIVRYRGHCLLHRAEVLQTKGDWEEAIGEVKHACDRLARSGKSSVGEAFYRLGELHRLRGEFEKAEKAFRAASKCERSPQPGMALLQAAKGESKAAKVSVCRVNDEVRGGTARFEVLAACVEVLLENRDTNGAKEAADELSALAKKHGAAFLKAIADYANGAVLLAEGDAHAAIAPLRQSWMVYCELGAPYDAARARALMAQACEQLGDKSGAELERAAARETFEKLGAATDLAIMNSSVVEKAITGGLTARELEVLRLIAAGKKNRGIAGELRISEKTVARHISNIFVKLDLESRAAATAYAYENKLV